MNSLFKFDKKIFFPASGSAYPMLGVAYKQDGYEIKYSSKLIRTAKNYYDTLKINKEMIECKMLPEGTRPLTAAELHSMEGFYKKRGKDSRLNEDFKGYFGENEDHIIF